MMKRPHVLRLWRDGSGEYRWQRKAGNGRVVGASTEGYASKRGLLKNLERMNPDLYACRVVDLMGGRMASLSREPRVSDPTRAADVLRSEQSRDRSLV